jgi:hypothetical protein
MNADANQTTVYQVEVTHPVTRELLKSFSFDSEILNGRTPLETAWDLAGIFFKNKMIRVRLVH